MSYNLHLACPSLESLESFCSCSCIIHGVWELIMQPQLTQTFLSACVESSEVIGWSQGRDIDVMQHTMHVKKCETSNLPFSDVVTCVCFRCFIFLIIFSQEKVLMDMKSFVIKK